jgi:hypothetical protein
MISTEMMNLLVMPPSKHRMFLVDSPNTGGPNPLQPKQQRPSQKQLNYNVAKIPIVVTQQRSIVRVIFV